MIKLVKQLILGSHVTSDGLVRVCGESVSAVFLLTDMVLGFTLGGVYVNCEHRVFCAVANSFAFCGPKEVYKTPNLASFCLFLDISIIRGATRYDTAENLSKLTFKLVACIEHIFVRPVFRIGFIPSVVLLAEETVITFSVVVIVGSINLYCIRSP